ncbi:gamma-glutamylcyclotransferase family protein [Leptolyngbya sp. BC1307]|uniref:gamma-glutamylcyclotransferase family protein n=1 Tax=Leptolyngbya sp. BC1307 TaxID=2029589 RepID=UPI000EFBAE1A|nr:gamma-glutamylcyclotransferase family protein [Leptolyngbya sp. BC1307]
MLYAAYGSNLHPLRLQQRSPTAQLLGTAAVPDMALRFHKCGYTDFSGKCNLLPCHGGIVYVAIYEISAAEMALLDRSEGAGAGYDRAAIPVDGFGECVTYLAAATHIDEALRPLSWYKALVLVGCKRLAFPAPYIEVVRDIPTVQDRDGDRHTTHMQLVADCANANKKSRAGALLGCRSYENH